MLDVATLRSGDSLAYTRSAVGVVLPGGAGPRDFAASAGWSLRLSLAGASVLNVDATAAGDDFLVTITPAQSAGLAPGIYRWLERVSRGAEAYTIAEGEVSILENLGAATPGAFVDVDEALLRDVEAELRARATEGGMVEGYSVANRSVQRMPTDKLYALRGKLRAQISRRRYGSSWLEATAVVGFNGGHRL